MTSPIHSKLLSRLKRYIISGLLVWLPIWVTIVVIKFILEILDQTILLLPSAYRIPGLGVVITLLIIIVTGFFAANFIGRNLVIWWDAFINYIPLVRTIHAGVKQTLETFIKPEGDKAFRKVVLVEFPRKDMWTIAFQTGDGTPEAEKHFASEKLISLFIPAVPNITSGFLVIVSQKEVIELDMRIDDGLKFVISLGVIQPEKK